MVVFLILYVNDILLVRNDLGLSSSIKVWLSTQFQMKGLGKVQYILGIKVLWDHKNKNSMLSHTTYIDKLLI